VRPSGRATGASIAGNAVFAASGRVWVKLDLATGNVILRKRLQQGNSASSSPAVGEGLAIMDIERDDLSKEVLTARSALTGEVVWSVAYPHGNTYPIVDSSPAIAAGVVYAGFSDHHVRAFDATTGMLLWEAVVDEGVFSSPSVANGQLEIGTDAGTLYAFRLP
jgi:outer membrane protein assembly factor BamB